MKRKFRTVVQALNLRKPVNCIPQISLTLSRRRRKLLTNFYTIFYNQNCLKWYDIEAKYFLTRSYNILKSNQLKLFYFTLLTILNSSPFAQLEPKIIFWKFCEDNLVNHKTWKLQVILNTFQMEFLLNFREKLWKQFNVTCNFLF